MSKLQTALAIPIALFALKAFTKSIPETKTPPKPTTNGFTMGPAGTDMDIAPLFPEGLFVSLPGLGGTKPTGPTQKATGPTVPLGMGTDVVPFFPESAATAGEEFAAKKPFEFKPELFPRIDLSKLKEFKL